LTAKPLPEAHMQFNCEGQKCVFTILYLQILRPSSTFPWLLYICMWDYRKFQTSGDGTAFGGHLSVVRLALQITVRGSYISNFICTSVY